MNAASTGDTFAPGVTRPEGLKELWLLLVGTGAALVVLGALAVVSAFVASLATTAVFGTLLLLGAIFQTADSFWVRRWRGSVLSLLAGALYLSTGLFLVEHPVEATRGLALVVAGCLLVGGSVRVTLSLVERFQGWAWWLVNGAVALVLGVAIWRQWPVSGDWVIGLFVGIEMVLSGLSWVMLGVTVRTRETH